jgi:ATP-dependent DNA helicase RecQ
VPADEVKELLNALADAGLIERHGIEGGRPGAFVLALTAEGRRVAKGEHRPDLALPAPRARDAGRSGPRRRKATPDPSPTIAPAAQPDPELLARLKAWRLDEARRQGIPPYVVFHDSTLTALAAAPPRDRTALGQVRGIGPAKLEAYGEALLRLLA